MPEFRAVTTMANCIVIGKANILERVTFTAAGPRVNCVVVRRTPWGPLAASCWGTNHEVMRRACQDHLDALEQIAETCAQPWSACHGRRSDAKGWHRLGFTDGEVQAWHEVGVYDHLAAGELRLVGIGPRDVAREYEDDQTLGYAYAAGDVRLQEVQNLVLGRLDDG